MSSIFGHALIGASIGDNANPKSKADKAFLYLFFVALSINPDLDYLPTWFFGLNMEPRYSHSVLGCLAISLAGLLLKKYVLVRNLGKVHWFLIVVAPMSHIVLDYFVGVHKNPILWPMSNELFAFSHGVLPSAGKLDFRNYYFWRNLLIELGILIPVAFILSKKRKIVKNKVSFAVLLVSFLFFGYMSYGLQR